MLIVQMDPFGVLFVSTRLCGEMILGIYRCMMVSLASWTRGPILLLHCAQGLCDWSLSRNWLLHVHAGGMPLGGNVWKGLSLLDMQCSLCKTVLSGHHWGNASNRGPHLSAASLCLQHLRFEYCHGLCYRVGLKW